MDSVQINAGISRLPEQEQKKKGISGSTVKLIAVAAMLIDHFAAVVVTRVLIEKGLFEIPLMSNYNMVMEWLAENGALYWGMMAMRLIGRLGFPIFCFLLVEGFQKTRNIKKYIFRLGLFALISEVPFNLAIRGKVLDFGYQNVYFTLLIGILALCAIDFISQKKLHTVWKLLLTVSVTVIAMIVAELLHTDYSGMGVLTIVVMYLFRKNKVISMLSGCIVLTLMSLSEITVFFTLLPVALYNGERGLKMKYFFYAFYPLHLFLLWLIAYVMGMGWISAV